MTGAPRTDAEGAFLPVLELRDKRSPWMLDARLALWFCINQFPAVLSSSFLVDSVICHGDPPVAGLQTVTILGISQCPDWQMKEETCSLVL